MTFLLGDEWVFDDLGGKVTSEYQNWLVDHQVASYSKHFDGTTFVTVWVSGRIVPGDRLAKAFQMINNFLNSQPQVD